MATSGDCKFSGKVQHVRVVGTGRASLLDNQAALEDGHLAWVQPFGAQSFGNTKIDSSALDGGADVDRGINPIHPNGACQHYDVTYKAAADHIEIVVAEGGENGLFVGELSNGRNCLAGCIFDWPAEKRLWLARADRTSAKLAQMPIRQDDASSTKCSPTDGGAAPVLGVDTIQVFGIENGVLQCGSEKETLVGNWDFLPGNARSLFVNSLEVQGNSLHLSATMEHRPLRLERFPRPEKPLLAAIAAPFPWLEAGGIIAVVVMVVALGRWGWSKRGSWTPALRLSLHNALLDAFRSRDALQIMLRNRLNKNLNEIAGEGKPLEDTVYKLLEDAEAKGYTRELVQAARAENPGNELLRDVAQRMGVG